jgi:hypothetical protein
MVSRAEQSRNCIVLYCIIWYCIVLYGIVWYGIGLDQSMLIVGCSTGWFSNLKNVLSMWGVRASVLSD